MAAHTTDRACGWCERVFRPTRPDQQFHSVKCRQSAFRLRRRRATLARAATPLRCAYADPPYPGLAWMYRKQPTYGGEVDHRALIARLCTYDGWALSTGAYALREILPMCPPGIQVCPWVKPIGVSGKTNGLHNAWEPLLVMPARREPPGFRDWISTPPARLGYGGDLIGRKPLAFAAFLFACLGILPGDSLDDLFPGTGIIGKSWAYLSSGDRDDAGAPVDPSLLEQRDAVPAPYLARWERIVHAVGDPDPTSAPGSDDASPCPRGIADASARSTGDE